MTPKSLGYSMPAEWELHQATWLSWPHKEASWPGKLPTAQAAFAKMVAALVKSEPVRINVGDAAMQQQAQALLDEAGARGEISFHLFPTNDAWCRDHGAIFVRRESREAPLAAVNWQYNAWGGKYPPFDLDNEIPRRMADFLDVPRFDGGMVLEGGSIDVNGRGLLLTSEACLLNPNRNPHFGRQQIETRLREFLGAEAILWLEEGIVGDDTDGHIDDIARFLSPGKIAAIVEEDPADENYQLLQDNWKRLQSFRDHLGQPFRLIKLPTPGVVEYKGQRLPASYANFYLANRLVLVPNFRHQNDQLALNILQREFPSRRVIGIDSTDLIWGLGSFHCITQQEPG